MSALEALRAQIARMERHAASGRAGRSAVPFGIPGIDGALPAGGILRGALHEAAGAGPDAEHGAAAALLVAGILARADAEGADGASGRPVLWACERFDLFAPGLAGAGLAPARVLHVEAGRAVLAAMEEGLRHPGLAGVVGELTGRLSLTASRRLHLAAEASGILAFVLRRARRADADLFAEPGAAVTRWRVACLPSAPPLPHAPEVPGLGRARWRLDLVRCRGGEPASWIVEGSDAQGRLRLAADFPDRPAAAPPARIVQGRRDERDRGERRAGRRAAG